VLHGKSSHSGANFNCSSLKELREIKNIFGVCKGDNIYENKEMLKQGCSVSFI